MNTRVVAAVDDMFFAARIRGTGEQMGVGVEFARSVDALVEAATRHAPALVIVDLHAGRIDPFALARRMKADERLCDVPLVGFFSHVQTELYRRAQEAGFDHVFPRSAFTRRLPEILQGNFKGSSE